MTAGQLLSCCRGDLKITDCNQINLEIDVTYVLHSAFGLGVTAQQNLSLPDWPESLSADSPQETDSLAVSGQFDFELAEVNTCI